MPPRVGFRARARARLTAARSIQWVARVEQGVLPILVLGISR